MKRILKTIWITFFAGENWFFSIVLLLVLVFVITCSVSIGRTIKDNIVEYTVLGTVIDKYVQPPTAGFLSSTRLRRISMIDIDNHGVRMVENDDIYYNTEISDRIKMKVKFIKDHVVVTKFIIIGGM